MRYMVTRSPKGAARAINAPVAYAPNRKQADALFTEYVAKSSPGEEVELFDTKDGEQNRINYHYHITPAEKVEQAYRALDRWLESQRISAEKGLTEFANKVLASVEDKEADTTYYFRWADGSFAASWTLRMVRHLTALRAEGLTLLALLYAAQEQLQRAARYPERSTSACTTLLSTYKVEVWARAVEKLTELHNDAN